MAGTWRNRRVSRRRLLAAGGAVAAGTAGLALTGCGGDERGEGAGMVEWGYAGTGAPDRWASLNPEFYNCAEGRHQSPIDLTGYAEARGETLTFDYGGGAPEAIDYDGLFMHVRYAPGNLFMAGEVVNEVVQTHLHTPSEHLIDGAAFPVELHIVHQHEEGPAADRWGYSVVGVLFEPGEPSPVIQSFIDGAPPLGTEVAAGPAFDLAPLVPADPAHYRYDGSTTTPPCVEPVDWYVLRERRTVSPEQVARLRALHRDVNARPVQPLGDRRIVLARGR